MSRLTASFLCVSMILSGVSPRVFASDAPRREGSEPSASVDAPKSASENVAKKGIVDKSVDLRPFLQKWGLEPRVQGDRNTCSVFVVTAAVEYATAGKLQRGTRWSVEFLNWASNQPDQSMEDGGCFSEIWKGYETYGICSDAEMPYREKFDPALKPSEEAIAHAKEVLSLGLKLHWIKEWDDSKGVSNEQLAEIKKTLRRRWPVCGGFLWPKREHYQEGILNLPPRDKVHDGHSVLLVGYRDDEKQPGGGVFLFRNTAGPSRDSLMTYKYAQTYMNDAAWIGFEGAKEGSPATEKK
jgi:hypothetical protein